MKNLKRTLVRPLYGLVAVALFAAAVAPALLSQSASAAQVTTRYIKMSNSTPSGSAAYSVKFVAGSAHTPQKFIVDFCSNSPLIGTSCTAPTGFSVSASPTFTNNPDTVGANLFSVAAGWTASSLNSNRTFVLTNASNATALATSGSNSIVNFSIDTVTNPSTACASTGACNFYARVVTYTASGTTYTAGTEGAYTDQGGFALSTASAIAITARVMETLSFCVFPDDNGGGAGSGTCGNSTAIEIGTGTPKTLSTGAVDTTDVKFSLSTNALSGAVIRIKGDTLKSGGNSIAAAGAAAVAIVAGTPSFGVRISTAGSVTPTAPYNNGSNYGLDITTAGDNLLATYGDQFADTAGAPVASSTTTFRYAATVGNTTPAGIYTATHQLIAVGTF